ncbi:Fe-S cluster assembly ATPase SufC [Candidatus Gottesmanbacteria bacterium]|nr:Fe-S cluster assembly ATPase SufC [Candidatus Gottesmanbacteria bacterium]
MRNSLTIKDIHVKVDGKDVVHDVNLSILPREVHVIMGPNGSGKSSLSLALAGHPKYKIVTGKIYIRNKDITSLEPHERAQHGLMLAFQNPVAIPGVALSSFLRTAYYEIYGKKAVDVVAFHRKLEAYCGILHMDKEFLKRSVNDGFSGGEKKKIEMLEILTLQPKFAIFDEIDTGLDIDALKIVSEGINSLKESGAGVLLITHYQRILNFVPLSHVHIMIDGRIIRSGGIELVEKIERTGYANI